MKKTLLAVAGIFLLFNSYASDQPPQENSPQASRIVEREVYEPLYQASKWRFAIDAGFSYRIAKAADGVDKSDINKLRPGFHYAAEVHGFWDQNGGIGLKAFGQHHSATIGLVKDKLNIYYVGPSIMFRSYTAENKNAFIFAASLGYMHYNESAGMYEVSKGTLGSTLDVGYDIRISDKTFIGFKLSFSGGVVKITSSDLPISDEYNESLASINLSVGLRF